MSDRNEIKRTEDETFELINSLKTAMCEAHFGRIVKLPDGTEVSNHETSEWLKSQGVDFELWEFWGMIGTYYHCEPEPEPEADEPEEPEADLPEEDFNKILSEMFEDEED
jgi:hypothetical protein